MPWKVMPEAVCSDCDGKGGVHYAPPSRPDKPSRRCRPCDTAWHKSKEGGLGNDAELEALAKAGFTA